MTQQRAREAPGGAAGRPGPLVALVALVVVEAVALLVVAGAGVVRTVGGEASDSLNGVLLSLLPAGAGAYLLACGRGLWRGAWWPRAPVVTWQLLQLAIGVSELTRGDWQLAVPLLAVSALVVMLVVSPPVTAATRRRDDPPVT